MFFNASPRNGWNTAKMLESAVEGAREAGAETETVNLYDFPFAGCKSCFACKLKNAMTNGVRTLRDGLGPVLERARRRTCLSFARPSTSRIRRACIVRSSAATTRTAGARLPRHLQAASKRQCHSPRRHCEVLQARLRRLPHRLLRRNRRGIHCGMNEPCSGKCEGSPSSRAMKSLSKC